MPEMACVPACKTCREAGLCTRYVDVPATERYVVREWAPNRIPKILLPCGHMEIPWPLVHYFGQHFSVVYCHKCGEDIQIPDDWKKKQAKKTAKLAAQVGLNPQLDIPPF